MHLINSIAAQRNYNVDRSVGLETRCWPQLLVLWGIMLLRQFWQYEDVREYMYV